MDHEGGQPPDSVRLDVWLDVACLFKTRSEAQRACAGGKIDVNGQPGKPHKMVRVGDALRITRSFGKKQSVVIRMVAERHVPKAEARLLYEDTTPPPTPEELEWQELERAFRRSHRPGQAAPSRRDQRAIRRLKGHGE